MKHEEPYSLEKAEEFAARMKDLVGKSGKKEDYDTAGILIEETDLRDPQKIEESLKRGEVTIIPPAMDKTFMIALDTSDPLTLHVFNVAAREVLRKFTGFHQVGHNNETGYTAWELLSLFPPKIPARDLLPVVEEIKEKMEELRPIIKDLYSYKYPEKNAEKGV